MAGKEMDNRFAHVMSDPRFRTLRKSDKKVKIDKRFHKMFTENRFRLKYSVDKRGKKTKRAEDYNTLYDLSDEDNEDNDHKDEPKEEEDEEVVEKVAEEEVLQKPIRKPPVMNARGRDSDEDSEDESSSSESEESEEEDEEIDHQWNEWDKDVTQTETATKRVAICNIDWDRINATDLFVLINSFKPSGGSILAVKIYPSELGLQRMKAEAESGPIQFIKRANDGTQLNEDNDEFDNEEEMDSRITEQLRQYEMTRLKYFYAVVECDTEATADVLYKELDGMEYESSSSTLDLRFIPEDMDFDGEPKSECHSMPNLSLYKAPQFINSALQQSKVRMTWDETDPKRKHALEKAFNKDEDDDDLNAYLATSSEEESEAEEIETPAFISDPTLKTTDKINKYKELLNTLSEPKESKTEEGMEMEISWEPNLKDMVGDLVDKKEKNRDNSTFDTDFTRIKERRKEKAKQEVEDEEESEADSEEPIEKTIPTKSKNKNKHRKGDKKDAKIDPELDLLLMDSEEDHKKHFNYKSIVENEANSKKRKQETNDFTFNAEDPRFGAVYTSHHYNVDPSDPHYKKTDAFEKIMNRTKNMKKSKATQNDDKANNETEVESSKNSWTQLVRTVKNKTQLINTKQNKFKQMKQNRFKS
ncbi:unnamed protein product [Medioppia subpectinata]|uniref:ESF1-like protein n=1 Tax=Medioppia subpectinata TaxID=1979941 RepID=A0A7R9KNC5_9ACAR|nr:unnamed protein product [Medioppia subpectinata]CAG2105591.1 unnamed protein product [Medioppia subpectinata]